MIENSQKGGGGEGEKEREKEGEENFATSDIIKILSTMITQDG